MGGKLHGICARAQAEAGVFKLQATPLPKSLSCRCFPSYQGVLGRIATARLTFGRQAEALPHR
jgi:hypothetical protein